MLPDSYNADVWWITPKLSNAEPEFHKATIDWLTSLGLDPNRLAPVAGVVRYNGAYELHVDDVLRSYTGHDRFDPLVADTLLTVRRIVPVVEGTWPAMPRKDVV